MIILVSVGNIAKTMRQRSIIDRIDILRSAKELVEQYGAESWFIAAQRADARSAQGDADGQDRWLAAHHAITALVRRRPIGRDRLH